MPMFRTALALAALAYAGDAVAQSTTCMDMGGGMVHCDTIRGGGKTIGVIADLIARSNERSFQKKVGALLAKGDCAGAAKLAFEKGRLELGNQISAACSQRQGTVAQPSTTDPSLAAANGSAASPLTATIPELERRLQLAAAKANAATPSPLNNITTATKVEAIGTQILITANVNEAGATLTEADRTSVTNQICANMASPELLKAGASIRIIYLDRSGQYIGSVMVTRSECGL